MYESFKKSKKGQLGGLFLLLWLLTAVLVTPVGAIGVTQQSISSAQTLIPVGHTIGVKLFSRGVMVVKLSDGATPAKSAGLQKGDVILKCGGINVNSTEQFQQLLADGMGEKTPLQVRRGSATMTMNVSPAQNDAGDWSIGAWIRDSMAGIGTVRTEERRVGKE